jgi:hypothetical protein
LNRQEVTQEERDKYGAIMERIVALKAYNLVEEMDKLKQEFAEVERTHGERLAKASEGLK